MAIEGLDAAVLIENTGFVPLAELPKAQGAEVGPTLDAALAEARLSDRRVERRETLLDRLEMLKADLWVSPAFQIRRAMPQESVAMTPLRDLDDAELALIAGGSGSDMNGDGDIVVTGHRYWDWNFPENDPNEEYPDGTGSPGGPTSYLEQFYSECELDNQVDFKAQLVAAAIKAMPDWNEREYAAVIYMVNGEIRVGPLLRGMTVAEAQAAGLNAPRTDIYAPPDLGDGIILAVVHSHPDVGYDGAADVRNRYPSGHVGGDYDSFDAVVGSDPRFTNNAGFAQYILGPDGLLREFNAKDGRINSANDQNPDGRTNLAADRPCSQ